MSNNLDISFHNKFEIEVVDSRTKEIKEKRMAYNTICHRTFDEGFCKMDRISYGNGDGSIHTPSYSDNDLFSYIGTKNTSAYKIGIDWESGWFYVTRKAVIESSEAVGYTISEVGLGTHNAIYTHAMLTDQHGLLSPIEKTSIDVVNLYATVYIHFNVGDFIPRLDPDRVGARMLPFFAHILNVNYISRWGFFFHNNQGVYDSSYEPKSGLIPSSVIFNTSTSGGSISLTYNSSLKKWTFKCGRLEAGQANDSCGFRRIALMCGDPNGTYSPYTDWKQKVIQLKAGDSWFPYSSIENESIGTGDGETSDYKFKFMYPHDVVIKVNGVEQNPNTYTVDYAPPTTGFGPYIDRISNDSDDENHYQPRSTPTDEVTAIVYNPAYVVGLSSINIEQGTIEGSNNLTDWDEIGTRSASGSGVFTIPDGCEHYKYYRFKKAITQHIVATAKTSYTGYNLHFNTPPANGALITASYRADCVAKDSDRVFDISIDFSLSDHSI